MARQRYSLNASVFAVLRQGNRVLALRRSGTGWLDDHWSLPAGAHDGQTSLADSVLRELREETSLTADVSDCRLLHVQQVLNPDGVEWLGLYFGVDTFTGIPMVAEPEKHDAIEWRNLTEAVDPTVPYVKAARKWQQPTPFLSFPTRSRLPKSGHSVRCGKRRHARSATTMPFWGSPSALQSIKKRGDNGAWLPSGRVLWKSMRTLLGKKLRIVAMPQKLLGKNGGIQDWRAVLAMDGSVCLRHVPSSGIRIRECGSEEVIQLGLRTDAMSDSSRSLLFEVELDREILSSYLHHTRQVIEKKSSEPAVRQDRELRGVVFAGELSRAFKHKVLMLIIAAHIADPRNLSLNRIFSDDFQGRFGSEAFSMPFIPDHLAIELDLKSHGAHEVFRFIEDGPHDTADVPNCQLMKGLTYLSHTFRSPLAGEALTSFVWALAATEAMLSTHADKGNVTMLELRLKALLGDSFSDVLIGRFREIYKYRNALLHGNVSVPFSFDSRNVLGYREIKNSNTMPFGFSQFTYGLALKIMQRYFELGSYDIGYRLDVATKPSPN